MDEEGVCNLCQKHAHQKCGACQNIFYCSKEHQKADWKNHRGNCHPFKVASSTEAGRYLIATKNIKRNEIILKEKPLIYGPAQESIPVCLGCNQEITEENYRLCTRCGWPMCSKRCQDMPCHMPECFYTVMSKESISIPKENFGSISNIYQVITVLRCLFQKENNPMVWNKLLQLESHTDKRMTTERYQNEKVMASELIHRLFKLHNEFTVDEILTVCGIIMINAHEVPLSEPPFIAIYENTSMFENDCSSNCSKSFTNVGEILITSGVEIGKGDNLSICYADPLWNTMNRRNFLYETKYFWCSCKRCSDTTEFGTNFSNVFCQNGLCDGFLIPKTFLKPDDQMENWTCTKCDYSVSNHLVNKLLDKIANEIAELDKIDKDKCKAILHKLKSILPPHNFLIVEIKLALCHYIGQTTGGLLDISNEDLELKRSVSKELVDLTELLIPSEKRVRGLIYFELHACLAELARRRSVSSDSNDIFDLLEESKLYLRECIELLKHEPEIMPEGKICKQAKTNLRNLIKLF